MIFIAHGDIIELSFHRFRCTVALTLRRHWRVSYAREGGMRIWRVGPFVIALAIGPQP